MQKLLDLTEPLIRPKAKQVQDEFFGVYCLVSQSEEKLYKNRCYIGYTVDPNRRIRQHNAGHDHGGAKKTDSRGPWDMVCIIHGFPNSIAALQFEWAWQNPDKSRRVRRQGLKKDRKEAQFAFRFRIACQMLNTRPWQEMALTFRWLVPDYELPFPAHLNLPSHMKVAHGPVQKFNIAVPLELNAYTTLKECHLCGRAIQQIQQMLRCQSPDVCGARFHARCLAEHCLKADGLFLERLYPMCGHCPKCAVDFLWGDLVRDQRTLLLVEDAKPVVDGMKIAGGMIPRRLRRD